MFVRPDLPELVITDKPDTQKDLLPALARVVRGTSILFWGLPIAMVISVMATISNWTDAAWPMGMLMAPVAFGMLWYGLWLLGSFQPVSYTHLTLPTNREV